MVRRGRARLKSTNKLGGAGGGDLLCATISKGIEAESGLGELYEEIEGVCSARRSDDRPRLGSTTPRTRTGRPLLACQANPRIDQIGSLGVDAAPQFLGLHDGPPLVERTVCYSLYWDSNPSWLYCARNNRASLSYVSSRKRRKRSVSVSSTSGARSSGATTPLAAIVSRICSR